MNELGTGALDSLMKAQITQDVTDLIQDGDIPAVTAVILTPSVGQNLNTATGVTGGGGDQDSVTGFLGEVSLREVMSNPAYQTGDQKLVVLATDLTVAPATATAFRVGAVRYDVIDVGRDALGIAYHLIGRRAA